LFPAARCYPVYFAGDITNPAGKKIFVGINPGYTDKARQIAELEYLERVGLFNGYCNIFSDFFAKQQKGLLAYFANIVGFLRRYYEIEVTRDWDWIQSNLISLDLIPYHSSDAQGLRINDPNNFRRTYFEIFLRILEHLGPIEPIFLNGFPTLERYLRNPAFSDVIKYAKHDGFWIGTIADKFSFIGLPFLNRVAGGKEALIDRIKRHRQDRVSHNVQHD
jgi:hypothetical protein